MKRICLVPRLQGVGGMVSFQHKLTAGLAARGYQVCYELEDKPYSAVLVIGGTRQLGNLWRAGRQGVRIIQRLDGMNWLHRLRRTGSAHYLRAEYGNFILSLIRSRLADGLVYQSRFAQEWWERVHGPAGARSTVIYNGVDLGLYTPLGPSEPSTDRLRLLLVEGSLMGGYEQGLENAVGLAVELARQLQATPELAKITGKMVELMVVGRVAPDVQARWSASRLGDDSGTNLTIRWAGLVPQAQIPAVDRSAHLLYSADINAACPNSVIEALACGTPVVAFATGALPELVTSDCGRTVAYGSDPWRLGKPDLVALVQAAAAILVDIENKRLAARSRAEELFGLDLMVEKYLDALGVQ